MNLTTENCHELRARISGLAASIPTEAQPTARDWAGFFAALAAFAQAILPLILPLFTKPNPPTT